VLAWGKSTSNIRDEEHGPLPAGSFIWHPRGIPHTITNVGDTTGRMLIIAVPAGLEGMFLDTDQYFSQLRGDPDLNELKRINDHYGTHILAPGDNPSDSLPS
jgi:hypothetical protein